MNILNKIFKRKKETVLEEVEIEPTMKMNRFYGGRIHKILVYNN